MLNSKKIQSWLPLLLSIMVVVGMVIGYKLFQHMAWREGSIGRKSGNSVQQVLDLVKYKYVDSIALDSIEQQSIFAITEQLDPHSVFIAAQEMADIQADLTGNFSGIGVEYQMIRDTLVVIRVVEKGPAAQAGIQSGDLFIAVNDSVIAGKKLTDNTLRNLLRGKRASKVSVTLVRDGKLIKSEITRGNVPMPSLDAFYMVSPGLGYIKLNRFAETTFFEFMDAATALNKSGMKKLILDLRGNGGGLMEEATKIADELLEDGLKIVETKGANIKTQTVMATKPGLFENGHLVVLIDEQSASASEVLAGALQDHDRATIIGRRSFGKGLVQEQYGLANGGAIRLTVARYYTPLGRSIQKPYTNGNEVYRNEIINRFHDVNKEEKNITDTAKAKKFVTRKGKVLYEAGGILPEIMVPFDTTLFKSALIRWFNSNQMNEMVFELFKIKKEDLKKQGSVQAFSNTFQIENENWQTLVRQISRDSLPVVKLTEKEKHFIETRLKAQLARFRWHNQGYFEIMNVEDAAFNSAVTYLQNKTNPPKP